MALETSVISVNIRYRHCTFSPPGLMSSCENMSLDFWFKILYLSSIAIPENLLKGLNVFSATSPDQCENPSHRLVRTHEEITLDLFNKRTSFQCQKLPANQHESEENKIRSRAAVKFTKNRSPSFCQSYLRCLKICHSVSGYAQAVTGFIQNVSENQWTLSREEV